MVSNKNRKQKIEILKGIASGKITPEQLRPGKTYFFNVIGPGLYVGPEDLNSSEGSKQYDEQEYKAFCDQAKKLPTSIV